VIACRCCLRKGLDHLGLVEVERRGRRLPSFVRRRDRIGGKGEGVFALPVVEDRREDLAVLLTLRGETPERSRECRKPETSLVVIAAAALSPNAPMIRPS
jgi:hypothetical protein